MINHIKKFCSTIKKQKQKQKDNLEKMFALKLCIYLFASFLALGDSFVRVSIPTNTSKRQDFRCNLVIDEIVQRIQPYIGVKLEMPVTKNKGKIGHWIEDIIGVKHSSNCLDCDDGEVKSFPVKRLVKRLVKVLHNNTIVAKQTIAITMINSDDLLRDDFESSKVYQKMKKCLFIPYLREDNMVKIMPPILLEHDDESKEVYDILNKDYDLIRENFMQTNQFFSSNGTYMQTRTKGQKNTKTRAFYLRFDFIRKFLLGNNVFL